MASMPWEQGGMCDMVPSADANEMGSLLSPLWHPGLISSMIGLIICCMVFSLPVRDALIDGVQIHGGAADSVLLAIVVSSWSFGILASGPKLMGSIRAIFLLALPSTFASIQTEFGDGNAPSFLNSGNVL